MKKYFHVPFFTDFGFKTAWLRCSLFPRRALRVILKLKEPILQLNYIRNETAGLTFDSKAGVFDVICRDERQRIFIIEMQAGNYEFVIKRLIFYTSQEYCALIPKGNEEESFGNLPPVHCICIIKGQFLAGKNYHQVFLLKNESGEILFPGIEFHFLELGKFPILRSKWKTVKTDLEKLLYTMKYAHFINGKNPAKKPDFWEEPWISEVLDELELAKMSPQDRALIEMALVKEASIKQGDRLRMEKAQAKSEKRGEKRGFEKGIEKGIEKALIFNIRNMTTQGFPVDTIAGVLNVAPSRVVEIQKQLKKEPKIASLLREGKLENTQIATKLAVSSLLVEMVKSEFVLPKS